jgi:ubiquinone biosynthesis protein COQ9
MEPSAYFDELMAHIPALLEPAATPGESTLQLTTTGVCERLQRHYPSTGYTAQMVFEALTDMGYVQHDPYRTLEFVWFFK